MKRSHVLRGIRTHTLHELRANFGIVEAKAYQRIWEVIRMENTAQCLGGEFHRFEGLAANLDGGRGLGFHIPQVNIKRGEFNLESLGDRAIIQLLVNCIERESRASARRNIGFPSSNKPE
jgi:hypothetical protein